MITNVCEGTCHTESQHKEFMKGEMSMKILILTGSPHKTGTTAYLADQFMAGAEEAGHEAVRFDLGSLKINPCIGCYHCRDNKGECVFSDDMNAIYPKVLDAEAIVLVSPLYYFGLTAQLKSGIDRFFAINPELKTQKKTVHLISAGSDEDKWAMQGVQENVKCICRYLGWKKGSEVLAFGATTRKDVENSQYEKDAWELGYHLSR